MCRNTTVAQFKAILRHLLGETAKSQETHRNGPDSLHLRRNLNPRPREYDARALLTQPRSVEGKVELNFMHFFTLYLRGLVTRTGK